MKDFANEADYYRPERPSVETASGSGEPASGGQTRSRRTATVMSPRTLDVVRQRSRNQSSVMGMVAAVLAVLNVLAITSSAPLRNRTGDIRAKTAIWSRYHVTCKHSPATTTTISQMSDWKTFIPSFWPTLEATMPSTANG